MENLGKGLLFVPNDGFVAGPWKRRLPEEVNSERHVSNLGICRHYCMNGNIINTFCAFSFATTIAALCNWKNYQDKAGPFWTLLYHWWLFRQFKYSSGLITAPIRPFYKWRTLRNRAYLCSTGDAFPFASPIKELPFPSGLPNGAKSCRFRENEVPIKIGKFSITSGIYLTIHNP